MDTDFVHVKNSRPGFSLTEILVVVTVMVILIAMLVAGLSRARELARRADCLSNLHQLALAALAFRQNHNGGFPNDYQSPTGYWYQEIMPYDNNMAENAICPDAAIPSDPDSTTIGIGTAHTAWGYVNPNGPYGWLSGVVCSYGLNLHAGGYGFVPVVSAFGTASFGGNTNYYGSVASATEAEANGGGQVTGNIESGGSVIIKGGIAIGGNQYPNMPGMQPPSVTAIYNQIMQNDDPVPFTGGNTIDFSTTPYLLINGNFDASSLLNVVGSGTLVVTGNVDFSGQFPAQGTASMNIVALGNVDIHGQLSLDGSIYAGGNFINGGKHSIMRGDIVVGGYYADNGSGVIQEAPPPSFDPRANGTAIVQDQPLFADSIWVDGSPSDTDAVPTNLQTGDQTLNANDQMGRFCIDRHLGAINVSFTDGSARTVPLQNLWSLNWSGNFDPHNVNLP